MAERKLAENVAQVKADFKAIKDMAKNAIKTDLNNMPTSKYAGELENGIYVYSDGYYSRGIEEGNIQGYKIGLRDGKEQGKQAQRLEWWGKYLANQKITGLYNGFAGYGWTDETFDPPFDIETRSSSSMFSYSFVENLRGILARNNVKIIFMNTSGAQHYNVFANSRLKYCPYLTLSTASTCYGYFTNCKYLIEVDGYECTEKHRFETSSGTNKTFQGCTNLEHIIFHGTIANTINMQDCKKLDLESGISLLEHLYYYNGVDAMEGAYTKTVTLPPEVWSLLDTYFGNAQEYALGMGWNVA